MDCQRQKNLKNCPCTYKGCDLKGKCCECIQHHLKNKELPACCFSQKAETTFDRSFKKFISENS